MCTYTVGVLLVRAERSLPQLFCPSTVRNTHLMAATETLLAYAHGAPIGAAEHNALPTSHLAGGLNDQ
jgi:hypothetical protein